MTPRVSVLYREPKLLKAKDFVTLSVTEEVSVLYREPKLLKVILAPAVQRAADRFSALP